MVPGEPCISPPCQPALGQPLGPQGLGPLLGPATSQMALLGFTADSAVQVNRELWEVHLAGFGAPGCNSRGQSSQRSRGFGEQIKLVLPSCPHPNPGALSTPSPSGHGRSLGFLASPLDGSNTKNRLFMHHTKHTQRG